MRLSLIIVTKGRPERLRDTLASLRACAPQPSELVVVDGDPARSAQAVVAEHEAAAGGGGGAPVRYVATPAGLTLQRNRGVDAAGGDVLVFADDDVEFAADLFRVAAEVHAEPGVVGMTARIHEEDDRLGGGTSRIRQWLPGGGEQGTMTRFGYPRRLVDLDRARDVEFVHGCLMTARRDLAAELRFDESLTGYGLGEDEDFGYRLSRRGRVRYEPRAWVLHHNLGFRGSATTDFNRMLVRNRLHLFRKNFPAAGPLARAQFAMMLGVLVVHRALNREWRGVLGLLAGIRAAVRR